MTTICLSMIVKNEAHVIKRALDSAAPYVNSICVVDTGSTDGTQRILKNLAKTWLYERPWVNFAHNRQEALELARPLADYILFLDADDILTAPPNFVWPLWPELLPGYSIPVEYGDTTYSRCALIRSDAPWYWEGVLHEYLNSKIPLEQGTLDQPRIKVIGGGARSKDPETYKKDAALLEAALAAEPDNARYAFYLAQSYKDSGELTKALEMYQRRSFMAGWVEETWFARYQVGVVKEWLQQDPTKDYLNAFLYRPTRMEPLYQLAKYHRLRNEHALGYLYALHGDEIRCPNDKLFVDRSIYDWRNYEELALNAYYVGEKAFGRRIFETLIEAGKAPAVDILRFSDSLKWYV